MGVRRVKSASSIPAYIEKTLQTIILPDLEQGRKSFDLAHTKAVVYWMKYLLDQINSPDLDARVLIATAYAHDWGYFELFKGVKYRSIEEINKRKPLHMQRGAKMIEALLRKKLTKFFTEKQILRTAHLVRVHDLVEKVKANDEVLIMEADTLGMLDSIRAKPTFTKADNDKFMKEQILERRFLHFTHDEAKAVSAEVFARRENYYKKAKL